MKAKSYYLLAFAAPTGVGTVFQSAIHAFEQGKSHDFTVPLIAQIKERSGIGANSIMLSVSFLGTMNEAEFNPPFRPGMDATVAYLEGVRAGLENSDKDNPYPTGSVEAADYRNGRISGFSMREGQQPPQDHSPQ
ncbi:hypothetical protein PP756_gp70 [Pseudomonas phage VB_PaeP_VL1]|uniref:Uncharacterized protein n=1 Tax=Pseudomonas phage VB_PaeP_VL1 TaxID=2894395 RepID=A0AAE8YZ49_9CAUD|nr:hypothetical protein PP756_gp70 [Pseudomonas phage VB_PaeP_VL1]UGV19866.1 hypothetical protein vBPaePVL1_70 [Pseudomonas phage VB_PaeP_VL1]